MAEVNLKLTRLLMILVIFVDFVGMAMVVVLFPHVFLDKHAILFDVSWTQGSRFVALGFCLAVYPLGQFFGAALFGKLSDISGRKKILMMTILGTIVGFILSGISVEIGSFWLLFLSRLLAGLCAGNVAIAQASLIDISTKETKTKNLSLAQMAMGLAYVVGPSLGGTLADQKLVSWFSPSLPFWVFTVILVLIFVTLLLVYRETLNEVNKRVRIDMTSGFSEFYQALTDKYLGSAFIVWFTFICGWWLFESFLPTFLFEKFMLDTAHIGYLFSINGAVYATFQYLVVQRVGHKIKPTNMVLYSAVVTGVSIISLAFMPSVLMMSITMVIFVLSMGFCVPGFVSSISSMASHKDQGQVMGMIGSVQALATVLVMALAGFINAINIHLTIIAGGVLVLLSWVLFFQFVVRKRQAATSIV